MLETFIKTFSAQAASAKASASTSTDDETAYTRTAMVRHKGQVIAFAMDNQRKIFYTVLALAEEPGQQSNTPQQGNGNTAASTTAGGQAPPSPLDVDNWQNPKELLFPTEIARVGYGVADQVMLPVFKGTNSNREDPGTRLPDSNSANARQFNYFKSTTARFTADAPFQVMSDGQYVYVFRQAVARDDANNLDVTKVVKDKNQKDKLVFEEVKDKKDESVPMVDSTLLMDRFVLSGTQLKHKLEVRYQRSRSKTRPANRKDGLGAKDLDGNSFYEPTQELKFVRNLTGGQFTVLLLPTQIAEIQRWQIFACNGKTRLIDSFNVERSQDGLFNTRGSKVYTCPDHDQVYSLKAGNCVEPSVSDPSQTCEKELIPRVSTQGYAESALKFSGGGYVSLTGSGVAVGRNSFTQEIWFYLPDPTPSQTQVLISGATSLDAINRPPSIGILAGKNLRVGFGDGQNWHEFDVENVLTPAAWNHIAVTFNGKAYRIYVDGRLRLVTDQKDSVNGKFPANNPVRSFGTQTQPVNGTIDEIRLWNRARTQTELRSSMNQRLTGQELGLVGYWRFDEAEGNTVYDQTDNRVNGTIHNGTWVASDAPVGESLGINRTSFQVVTRKTDGHLEPRRVASGLTALLYYQQEMAPSGYSGKEKPLKMGARVMLAMATKGPDTKLEDKNFIASIDFGVSASGQLAQIPDAVPLELLLSEAPNKQGEPINDQIEMLRTLKSNISSLNSELEREQRLERLGMSFTGTNAPSPNRVRIESELNAAKKEFQELEEKLKKGLSVLMRLVCVDPYGLSISGGLLGFAWTEKAPFLFDSATGNLALYFQGKDNQFFATYYETLTERAKYPLIDQSQKPCVTGIANSTELEMDSLVITIDDGDIDTTCTVTIEGADITETWRNVPREPEKFVKVINGEASDRRYIGSGLIKTDDQGSTTLELSKGVKRSLTQTETLIVGTTRVTVAAETVALETTSFAVTTHDEALPNELLPVYWVEYDYATLAETTKVPADLYNGSLLIKVVPSDASNASQNNASGPITQIINQGSTSGSTFSSKWVAATPGGALAFNGLDSRARSPQSSLSSFMVDGDLTLEAWFKAHEITGDRAQIIQYYQSTSINYFISLGQILGSALRFDGTSNYVEIANPFNLNNQSFTLEAWIKPTRTNRRMQIISYGGLDRNKGLWFFVNGEGKIQFDLSHTVGPSSSQRVDDGVWHHVAVVYAAPVATAVTGNQIQIYIDGMASGLSQTMTPDLSAAEFMIGKGLTGHSHYFQGEIAEVRIWNQSRTQTTIQAERDRRVVGQEPGLAGYWRFEAGIAKDYSPNQKNGTLKGFSATASLTESLTDYYQIFVGVNNQLVRSKEFYPCGSWTHLATVFKQSYGVKFDGSGAYLDCGNDQSLNFRDGLTIEVSLKVDALGQPQILLGRGESKSAKDNGLPYSLSVDPSGYLRFRFDNVHGKPYEYKSTRPITTSFCKIAVTRKRKQQTEDKREGNQVVGATVIVWYDIAFYINGDKAGEFRYDSSAPAKDNVRKPPDIATSGRPLQIGKASIPGDNAPFKGIISEVRLWNVARDNIGEAPTEDGLVSWWRFEEQKGETAYDSKGANHAKIKGGNQEWVKNPDQNASELTLYFNGKPIEIEQNAPRWEFETTQAQFTLGASLTMPKIYDVYHGFFTGQLEEVRIWKTTRTQEQIQDNLFRRLEGEQENLVAYYMFDPDNEAQVTDHSFQGNHLSVTNATYVLSTAPIGEDIPQVRSALAGVKTPFNDLIESTPAVQEYGDLQFDSAGNMIGIFKRCYSFIKNEQWHLITGFKVGDLVSEWIGQVQFAPQLIGYIEGAPPVPSENLTGTSYVYGEFADYTGASSVELTQAQSTTYTYATSREHGFDMAMETWFGLFTRVAFDVDLPFLDTSLVDFQNTVGIKGSFENSLGWLDEATTGFGLTTTGSTRMELRGIVENEDAVAFPKIGRRFVPDNMGMALVKSQTADVFALRLKHNNALVSFQMRPNPDIPPDWNIITFPMNPHYVKQGSLDGKIGFEPDPDYPNALEYSPDSSYFKPLEAYALKNRIDREAVELETDYNNFKAGDQGRRADIIKNDNFGDLRSGFPKTFKRNLVNTYVWTSAGGLFAETQETIDVIQDMVGGSYAFQGMGGPFLDLALAPGIKFGFNLMLGGHINLSVTKTKESQTAFGLNVDIGKVESDAYLRDADGNLIMDKSAVADPTDPLSIRKWKPRLMPGRVDAYRFMTFYLEPQSDHFDLFFNQVVDPIWLRQSNEPNALALLQAEQSGKKPACWRIMHRVTFVSRVLPEFDEPTATPLEKALKSLDIESNYELIQQLSPFVQDALGSMGAFVDAVDKSLNEYLPELKPYREEIIRYMSLYFGVGDSVETEAEEVIKERPENKPPTVVAQAKAKNAQSAQPRTIVIKKEDGVELDGTIDDDRLSKAVEADGTPTAIFTTWSKVRGEGDVTFVNAHAPKTRATFTQRGKYVLRLTADDGYQSASDDITIVVNETPQISAGPDVNLKPGSADKLLIVLEQEERQNKTIQDWLKAQQAKQPEVSVVRLSLASGHGRGPSDGQWSLVADATKAGMVQFQEVGAPTTLATVSQSGQYVLRYGSDEPTTVIVVAQSASQVLRSQKAPDQKGVVAVVAESADKLLEEVRTQGPKLFAPNQPEGSESSDSYQWLSEQLSNQPGLSVVQLSQAVSVKATETSTVRWEKVSGSGSVQFQKADQINTLATFSQPGQYRLRLTVANPTGGSSTEDIWVVTAASSQTMLDDLLQESVRISAAKQWLDQRKQRHVAQLNGQIFDNGLGDPTQGKLSLEWKQVSGAGTVDFQNKNALNTLATFSQSGFYLLQLGGYLLSIEAKDDSIGGIADVTDQMMVGVASRVTDQLQALYTFEEGSGNEIKDVSGVGTALDLIIDNVSPFVTWGIPKLELRDPKSDSQDPEVDLKYPVLISSARKTESDKVTNTVPKPGDKVTSAVRASSEITVEAWIQPAGTSQGLARIITLSSGPEARNFTLGQSGDYYYFALRTRANDANATKTAFLVSGQKADYRQVTHLVCTRNRNGLTEVYLNGELVGSYLDEGDLSTWQDDCVLALGNELKSEGKRDRAWFGSYHLVAIYSRALSPEDVKQNYNVGADADLPSILSIQALESEDASKSTSHIQYQPAANGSNNTWFISKPELPVTVKLQASATDDRPSSAETEAIWSWVSAPEQVSLPARNQLGADLTFSKKGTYVLRLTYNDGSFTISQDVALVVNYQPTIKLVNPGLGDDKQLHIKQTDLPLTLSTTLDSGLGQSTISPKSILWSVKGNPSGVQFEPNNGLVTKVKFPDAANNYELQLRVDNGYLDNTLDVTVCVHKTPVVEVSATNLPTFGQLQQQQRIAKLPEGLSQKGIFELVGTIKNSGSGDPQRRVTGTWSQVSGPVTAELQNSSTSPDVVKAAVTLSQSGIYLFEFTVDNGYLSSRQRLTIIANRPPQILIPAVSPGTLNNPFTLEAVVSDDGLPAPANLQLTWSLDVGKSPQNARVDFADDSAAYTQARFSLPGEYTLRLTADDGSARTHKDVDIEVNRPPRIRANLVVLYTFKEESGNVIRDVSGFEDALNLQIFNDGNGSTRNVQWRNQGVNDNNNADEIDGLLIRRPTRIASSTAAIKIINAVKDSNAITLEAWVKPSDLNSNLNNLARILTLSKDHDYRNFTLFQGLYESPQSPQNQYGVRLRTTETDSNGNKLGILPLTTGEKPNRDLVHLVFTHAAPGSAILYVNGNATSNATVEGNFSNWDESFHLVIANEFSSHRAWLGQLYLAAIYNRALTPQEVLQNFSSKLDER